MSQRWGVSFSLHNDIIDLFSLDIILLLADLFAYQEKCY